MMFLINSRKSCVIYELPANRFLRFLAPCFLGPVLCTVCESVLLKVYDNLDLWKFLNTSLIYLNANLSV